MLRIESKNGRVFAVDLAKVDATTFSEGVVSFHLASGATLNMGGDAWGGRLTLTEANEIIDLWEDAHLVFEEDEVLDLPTSNHLPQTPQLDLTPLTPVAPTRKTGRSWKEIKRGAKN